MKRTLKISGTTVSKKRNDPMTARHAPMKDDEALAGGKMPDVDSLTWGKPGEAGTDEEGLDGLGDISRRFGG